MTIKKTIKYNSSILDKHQIKHIHFVGIGGAGMGGIAKVLVNEGYKISGSDLVSNNITDYLEKIGIVIYFKHCQTNISNADLVVISSAIAPDNPEIIAAHINFIPVIKRAELLAELMRFRYGIAVAGTHGKTTTTGMIASIYIESGFDPTFINGGVIKSLGSCANLGFGDYLIAEADESDSSFLYLHPIISIITGIESDHIGNYKKNFNNLKEAFIKFLYNLPFYGYAIMCIDDPVIRNLLPTINRKIITYGFSQDADVKIDKYQQIGMKSKFSIIRYNKEDLHITLNIPGYHNALNAAASIALATQENIKDKIIFNVLRNFQGIERRFDYLGEFKLQKINGKNCTAILIDDYGHHPTEILTTIHTIRIGWPNRHLIMLFQPHRFTRVRDLYDDFINVLSKVDSLLIFSVYPAGEDPIIGADSYSLCCSIKRSSKIAPILITDIKYVTKILSSILTGNDVIVTQGAGDSLNKITRDLVRTKLKSQ